MIVYGLLGLNLFVFTSFLNYHYLLSILFILWLYLFVGVFISSRFNLFLQNL